MNPVKSHDLESLKEQISQQLKSEEAALKKRDKVFMGVGVLLFLWLCFISFTVTHMTSLDNLLDFAQVKGSKNIASANQHLKSMAPKFMAALSDKVMDMPSQWRGRTLAQVRPEIDKLTTHLKDIIENKSTELSLKDNPDAKGMTDQRVALINELRQKLMPEVDNFYDQYSGSLRQMTEQLATLKNNPRPTETERLQRQVIGSWLALMDHRGVDWSLAVAK